MAFEKGHKKVGGRRAGVPNKTTAAMRACAAELIADPAYQESLRQRLLKGRAGRIEPLLWQYACGRPAGNSTGPESDATHYTEILNRIQRRQARGEATNGEPHGMGG